MILNKLIRYYFCFLLLATCFIIGSPLTFAECSKYPDYINVAIGGNTATSYQIGENIYIDSDLSSKSLSLSFIFENTPKDCFGNEDDIKFKFFANGIYLSANTLTTTSDNITTAKFIINPQIKITSGFTSVLSVKTTDSTQATETAISVDIDSTPPSFTVLSPDQGTYFLQEGDEIEIQYSVTDDKSGISAFSFAGKEKEIEDPHYTISGDYKEELTSSKTFIFEVKDRLGHITSKTIKYVIDNEGPVVSNFGVEGYSVDSAGDRYVSFSAQVKEDSFLNSTQTPRVSADFGEFSSEGSVVANCIVQEDDSTTFDCTWSSIDIDKINDSQTFNIKVTSQDLLGNTASQDFNTQIFFDNQGPKILDFYLINGGGIQNIFNYKDTKAKVYLKFSDDSGDKKITPLVDFGGIEYFVKSNCTDLSTKVKECTWNLGDGLNKYSEAKQITFSIKLIDYYGNPTTKNINITVDNVLPIVKSIELIETDDMKDGIVSSGEKINFRVYFEDDHLLNNNNFIYGYFSQIDLRDGMDRKAGICTSYNTTTLQCDFNGIVARNGYVNKSVYFIINDSAINTQVARYYVEIFKIGNEVTSSFKIPGPISITNVLNRNVLSNSPMDAWFEGNIEFLDATENPDYFVSDDVKIINYKLLSCNDSNMLPILLGARSLYPNEVMQGENGAEPSKDFILKFIVKSHTNLVDMNNKIVNCKMSVLKRDNETLYEPEIVDFKVNFSFYDLPADDMLVREAKTILQTVQDADKIGSWFDDVYNIYNSFDNTCQLVSQANALIATLSNAWIPISLGLHSIGVGVTPAHYGDNAIFPGLGGVSNILRNSPVKVICDWVTCRQGTWLTGYVESLNTGTKYNFLSDNFWQDGPGSGVDFTTALCTASTTTKGDKNGQ